MIKKTKRYRVSVGIPAYNEEANIATLLRSLVSQKQQGYILKEIIVVSDESTDRTEAEVHSLKDPRIRLIRHRRRQGMAMAQNTIKKTYRGDVLVLLNADIILGDTTFIMKLLTPFRNDETVGLVCCRLEPLPAHTLFEKIINFSVGLKNAIYESWNNGQNMYTCRGTARAFSRSFLSSFEWPRITAEDAYTYFIALQQGYRFVYQREPVHYYQSPATFTDHQRQSRRFLANYTELRRFFPVGLLRREYALPRWLIVRHSVLYALGNPFYFFSYLCITQIIQLFPGGKLDPLWTPSPSTKNLRYQ